MPLLRKSKILPHACKPARGGVSVITKDFHQNNKPSDRQMITLQTQIVGRDTLEWPCRARICAPARETTINHRVSLHYLRVCKSGPWHALDPFFPYLSCSKYCSRRCRKLKVKLEYADMHRGAEEDVAKDVCFDEIANGYWSEEMKLTVFTKFKLRWFLQCVDTSMKLNDVSNSRYRAIDWQSEIGFVSAWGGFKIYFDI